MRMLMTLQGASPGRIPELMRDLASMGQFYEITDKKGKGLPESGKGEAPEIPHRPEKSQSVA